MNELREALTQFFTNFFPDQVKLLVCDLLQLGAFHVDDHANLVDSDAHRALNDVKFLTPGVFQLANDKFGDCLGVCVGQNLIQFNLASINEETRASIFVHLMEASWHELSDSVFLAHKVVVQ